MKMSKVKSIVAFNVEKSLRNKWFVVLNAILLIITVVSFNFNTIKIILKENDISLDKTTNIYVMDSENLAINNIINGFFNSSLNKLVNIEKVEDKATFEDLIKNIDKQDIFIEIDASRTDDIYSKMTSKEGIDIEYYNIIEDAIYKSRYEIFARNNNIPLEKLQDLNEDLKIERVMLDVDNENTSQKGMILLITNYLVFFILMIVLSLVANEISQEKVSKSIEYILTSITAKEYLVSKVIAVNITLILQIVFSFMYMLIGLVINSILRMYFVDINFVGIASGMDISSILNPQMIKYIILVIFYIIITVPILSLIQAAISSKTTSIYEAGNTTILLVIINIVIYLISSFVITPLKAPGSFLYIASVIPIVSMYFLPAMLIIGKATILQIVVATVLLILSIPFILKICSNIFKKGILDYTNKKSKKKSEEKDTESCEIDALKRQDLKKFGFIIGMSVILFVALQFIATYALTPLTSIIYNFFDKKISLSNISTIINILVYIVSLYIPYLFVNMYAKNDISYINKENENKNVTSKNFVSWVKSIVICVPLVFVIQMVLSFILQKLNLDYDILEKFDLYDSSSNFSKALFFLEIAILPAIFEELYIRKAVLGLGRKYGDKFAVIFSAILFAIIHMNISQCIFAFLMGVILGIVVINNKGSIIPSGIIHLLNNGYAALALIFSNNIFLLVILTICYLSLILVGIVVIIREIVINIKEKKKIIFFSGNKNIIFKNYVYIICDYSMIVAIILVSVMMTLMQTTISLL